MDMLNNILNSTFKKTAILTASFFLIPASFSAENICKKLSQEQCVEKPDSCTWIKSYERKDGKTVEAYCRKKPASKE